MPPDWAHIVAGSDVGVGSDVDVDVVTQAEPSQYCPEVQLELPDVVVVVVVLVVVLL